MKWLEGNWRGIGENQPAFFEDYRFSDDSTLVTRTFSDSTMSNATEESRYELRGGRMAKIGEGPRWQVTRLDDSSVTFGPLAKATNSFTFTRQDADRWTAVLVSPPRAPGGAAQTVTYTMSRWVPPSHH